MQTTAERNALKIVLASFAGGQLAINKLLEETRWRGEIARVLIKNERLHVTFEWLAQFHDEDDRWEKVEDRVLDFELELNRIDKYSMLSATDLEAISVSTE